MSDDLLKLMGVSLRLGDCVELMRAMPDASVDSIVTDPPYHLTTARPGGRSEATRGAVMGGFMGMTWDGGDIAQSVEMWAEALRVLKPGGHLLAFSGTRTYHRMVCAIEDAGFDVRDQIGWAYGCLDESTEVVTERGVMPYHKAKVGDRALCYDVEHGEYTYQPILEIVEYDYSDTAYRLVGDFGEQVVSRNHRVIVERGGSEAFQLAETLQREACVPVLESLSALRQALYDARSTSGQEQNVQYGLQGCTDRCRQRGGNAPGPAQRRNDQVRSLRGECMEAGGVAAQGDCPHVQSEMQRGSTRRGVGEARAQGAGTLVGRVGGGAESAHDGRIQPSMEGWADVPQPEGGLRRSADQVRAMPHGSDEHGEVRWLCDGTPAGGGAGNRPTADASGVCASHQPRRDGQPTGEPDAVCDERRPQGVRAWGGHRSTVVRVVPFHYTGKVWCLRVPTGAFVAVRGGVAFPTGNSGFPKSLDVSKAIDKAAGAERARVPCAEFGRGGNFNDDGGSTYGTRIADDAITDAARQWQGWGTALKPAWEPICVARKPLIGTVSENVLAHGTGALNIDGCRVPGPKPDTTRGAGWQNGRFGPIAAQGRIVDDGAGRWPANLIHDGSDEVLAAFPQAPGQMAKASTSDTQRAWQNIYGAMACGSNGAEPRGDAGSAARFFYCAKASKSDRGEGNNHPTVKPTELMRYLCRLVTPPGGVVLDPFMGSGSTGKAAILERLQFIGLDLTPEYVAIARARCMDALTQI